MAGRGKPAFNNVEFVGVFGGRSHFAAELMRNVHKEKKI